MRKILSGSLCWMFLTSIVLSGCVTYKNIAHDNRYPTDYVLGSVYRFKRPVIAEKGELTIFGTYSEFILEPMGANGGPKSVEEFESKKKKFSYIAEIVKAGSLIKITKIQLEHNPENGEMVWIYGKFINVVWAKKTAELAFISTKKKVPSFYGELPMVDEGALELVHN